YPLNVCCQVRTAYQQKAIVNICAMITSIANLIAIIAVVICKGGLVWLVLAYSGFGLLVTVVSSIWLFGFAKPWLRPSIAAIDPAIMRSLFRTGWKFFLISIFWMVNLQTDNLII